MYLCLVILKSYIRARTLTISIINIVARFMFCQSFIKKKVICFWHKVSIFCFHLQDYAVDSIPIPYECGMIDDRSWELQDLQVTSHCNDSKQTLCRFRRSIYMEHFLARTWDLISEHTLLSNHYHYFITCISLFDLICAVRQTEPKTDGKINRPNSTFSSKQPR